MLAKFLTPARFAFITICGISSYFLTFRFIGGYGASVAGAGVGMLIAVIIISLESHQKDISVRHAVGGVIGLFLGLFTANLINSAFFTSSLFPYQISTTIQLMTNLAFGYFGLSFGVKKSEQFAGFTFGKMIKGGKPEGPECSLKVLDTSVIIDGRIMDIATTNFLEGKMVVPKFVLHELQLLADSEDHVRRSRGKRGLELLEQMKRNKEINIEFSDQDFYETREVDSKLILFCKKNGGKIVTNDFNLNKVAGLQGIEVLNINKLLLALKPVVVPGDEFFITILKPGKEEKQGIGYLEDGTMVVLENGSSEIGKEVHVLVTSVLQTAAGRMIFTRSFEEKHHAHHV